MNHYLLIDKSILPEYYEKVLQARQLLESGRVRDVSQAVRRVGISRSTYYKYRDFILEPSEQSVGRKAVLSMMLTHEPGVLSAVLAKISAAGGSILTITQSPPVHGQASVTISLDVGDRGGQTGELMREIENTPGVDQLRLLALE